MGIAIGGNQINKAYLGTTEIQKMYLGSELVFGGTTPPVGITPILANFNVIDSEKSMVYFSTPLGYPDGMTTTGFFINGKTITGVTKVNDTQGYFTVSAPFTFWEQAYTIRLGEIDDTNHRQSVLYNFSMESIYNNIAEPDANTNKYLSPSGSGTHSGDSEANAYSPQDIYDNGLNAGTTVWVGPGLYNTQILPTQIGTFLYIGDSGTPTSPIKFIGYKDNPVEGNTVKFIDDFTYTTASAAANYFDPNEFPVIQGSANDETRGIRIGEFENIIIKNVGITKTKNGIGIAIDEGAVVSNFVYNNCILGASGQSNGDGFQVPDTSTHLTAKECVAFDWDMTCMEIKGEYQLIDNCRGYGGNAAPNPDYTIGGANVAYSVIRDSKVQEFEGDHIGHGFGIKASVSFEDANREAKYNLIVGNDTKMLDQSENLYLRRKSVTRCVAKRNTSENTYCLARPGNGCQFNLWEFNYAINAQVLVGFSGNGESDPWPIPEAGKSIQTNGCIVRNNIATSVNRIFEATVSGLHSEGDNNIFLNTNMLIHNNTVDGLSEEFIYTRVDDVENGQTGWAYDFSGTEFKNNIFVLGTSNPDDFFYNSLVDQNDFIWDSNNWTEKPASWTLPTNETNRTELNPNFVDEDDYVPQTELDCPVLFGAELDNSENEREHPTTRGGVKGLNE